MQHDACLPLKDSVGFQCLLFKISTVETNHIRTNVRCCTALPPGQCLSKHQVSACTSSSSFQTAAQGGVKDIGMTNERFAKLMEEKVEETDKLYVGASGLLKDDAYEVVIQLRKKNCSKNSIDSTNEKTVISSETNIKEKQTSSATIDNIKETPANISHYQEQNTDISDIKTVAPLNQLDKGQYHEIQESYIDQLANDFTARQETNVTNKNMVDKACNPLNHDLPETKCPYKPISDLKSAYTQTSFSSPNQKSIPALMSSSASTSYMSPPQSVLPMCMRNKYCSGDQAFQQNIESEESPDYSRSHCQCHNCRHSANSVLKSHQEIQTERKLESLSMKSSSEQDGLIIDPNRRRHSKDRHKKQSNERAKVHVISPYTSKVKPKKNKINPVCESTSVSVKRSFNKKKADFDVNPMVVTYVNKLLSLNKESLRAIEVVNQDCSSVNTPGSSIIDMPDNFDRKNIKPHTKISLEQIKEDIIRQLVAKINDTPKKIVMKTDTSRENEMNGKSNAIKGSKKKQMHKVKSLKVSKKLHKKPDISSKSTHSYVSPKKSMTGNNVSNSRKTYDKKVVCCNLEVPKPATASGNTDRLSKNHKPRHSNITKKEEHMKNRYQCSDSGYSVLTPAVKYYENVADEQTESIQSSIPIHTSTQTNQVNVDEIDFIKVAESKLQNMEKIADLTEKCTMRLSNLAKVLEEVRKNKSAAYSQISTSDTNSDYEQKVDDKCEDALTHTSPSLPTDIHSCRSTHNVIPVDDSNEVHVKDLEFIPIMNNFPSTQSVNLGKYTVPGKHPAFTIEQICSKVKEKPPTVLEKSKLKNCKEIIVPHELSTVLEVDSPISSKFKNTTPHSIDKYTEKLECNNELPEKCRKINVIIDNKNNSNIHQEDNKLLKIKSKNDSAENSKVRMIDINQFNEIMLQPFISINDYAKDHKILSVEETSNLDDQKADAIADDVSSLHSEGSLPDVVSELLKRNIIKEPFKFDSGNSTTFSSDTTLSILALSAKKEGQKKTVITFKNKESDTSDTLSISSNPDLEQAFKNIGMGWASSTLKKTKEHLALSSSSNTSSSSISHFRIRNSNIKDIPALVTDSLTSALKDPKEKDLDKSKTVHQQTSLSNSTAVKEFLTNELAKRITFAASNRSDGDGEFVSLYETKMPEEMKQLGSNRADFSDQSQNNGNNRARTSTPVELFKSMTYHSSSNSNSSNALFSNIDELSSVKGSLRNHSSDQDNLTIPTLSLKIKKNSDCSKSD